MSIFKREKKEDTEVCGYLDYRGAFYREKENRDKVNEEYDYQTKLLWITDKFENAIRNMPLHMYSHFTLKDLDNISTENKGKLIEIFGEYLKIKK